MGSINIKNGCIELIFILMMVISSYSIECPERCQCSTTTIECPDAGLTDIPNDIPLTVTYINLSDNPLSKINRSCFLKFPKLGTLLLNNITISGPIFLPKSLINFGYSFNLITIESLKMMLEGKLQLLKRLELQEANVTIKEIFPLLPTGMTNLVLNGNKLVSLKKDDLKCCMNLKEFQCKGCSLKFIEPKTFDKVKKIAHIILSNNEVEDLPDKLFEGLSYLLKLDMRDNKLEYFNASRLGLQKLQMLRLGYNRIEALDFRHSNIRDIGLENNRIRRLRANSLGSIPFINELNMARNRITEISPRAFENIRLIAALVLHGNSIENLSGNLLKNTYVNTLFLHNNSLSNVDKFILGMKIQPSILTLYSNKKLKQLNTAIFKGISKHSRILISCNTLSTIKLYSKKKISIECSPSSDLIITTPFRFLGYDGYECKWSTKHMHFICKACPTGFQGNNDGKDQSKTKCTPCPTGSFYQDEIASLHCKNCPIGQYVPPSRSPGKDASDCQTCPQGTNTSKSAGTRACSCLRGYHRRHRFGACEKCKHAGFECVRDYPQLKQGFWMTWDGTGSSNRSCKYEFQSFILNLETFSNEYNRKKMQFNCELPIPIKCPKHGSCRGGIDSRCSLGYTGVLCGVCNKGYKNEFHSCVKCPKIYVIILKWIGFIALFILLCYIVSDKKNDNHRSTRMEPSTDEEKRTFVDIFISNFKILIGFYQTLIGVMNAYSIINWPNNLIVIISMMEYVQFEIIRIPSLRCINPKWAIDSVEEFWLSLIVYVAVPVFCSLYYLVKSCYFYYQKTRMLDVEDSKNLCGRNCVRIAALFMFIAFPLISTRIMHVLPESCETICTVKHNGVCAHKISFLRSDYSVNCPTMSTHRFTLIAAYCSFIMLCGLPLLLWVTLRKSLHKFSNQIPLRSNRRYVTFIGEDGMEENSDLEDDEDDGDVHFPLNDVRALGSPHVLKRALRFTYENYEDKFWYWEVIEMARKLIMTAGAALFFYNTKVGLSILIIVGIAFAILHAIRKPMKDGFDNLLQMLSLWVIPINLSAGAVIQSTVDGMKGRHGNDPESWKVGIFLIVINSLLVILIVGRFAKMAVEKIIARIGSLHYGASNKFL